MKPFLKHNHPEVQYIKEINQGCHDKNRMHINKNCKQNAYVVTYTCTWSRGSSQKPRNLELHVLKPVGLEVIILEVPFHL